MRKPLILLIGLGITNLLFSQKREDTVRAIINQGLRVYAKDENSFKEAERSTLDSLINSSATIVSTASFLKGKSGQLRNVGSNIDEWLKAANTANASGNYTTLVNTIEGTLKNPHSTDKNILSWRSQHVDALFKMPVNAYLNPSTDRETETPVRELENVPAAAANIGNTGNTTSNGNSMLTWIALGLGIISLLGIAALFLLVKNKVDGYHHFKTKYRDEVVRLWQAIDQLKKKSPEPEKSSMGEDKIAALEAKITSLESKLKDRNPASSPRKEAEAKSPVVIQPAPKKIILEKPVTKTFYAKLADLENGFTESILTDSQNGEQIYEITTKDKKATFLITNNANAQKYALSDYRYYLEKACDFLNEPTPNCRIDTKETGELTKIGNDWILQKKALVQFI